MRYEDGDEGISGGDEDNGGGWGLPVRKGEGRERREGDKEN